MSENDAVFENGQMDIHNHDCTARPNTSRTKVYAASVWKNWLVKTDEAHNWRSIRRSGVVHRTTQHSTRRNIHTGLLGCLTDQHKNRRFEIVLSRLQRFKEEEEEKKEFLESTLIGDQTRVYPRTKQIGMQWRRQLRAIRTWTPVARCKYSARP
jgi:hypothetical protein